MNSKDQTKRIVIANSYLTMEIKNIQSQKEFQSKQVEINEIDGASWNLITKHRVYNSFVGNYYSYLSFEFIGFPKQLQDSCHIKISIKQASKLFHHVNLTTFQAQQTTTILSSEFSKLFIGDSVTFDVNVVIDCIGSRPNRNKFYDPAVGVKALQANVALLTDDPTFSDFTFIVKGKEFKLHKIILAAASPVMRKMFTTNMEESRENKCIVDDIGPEIFEYLVKFIYRHEVPENIAEVVKPLYEAAHYYQVDHLKEICEECLLEEVSEQNALENLKWAELFDLKQLKIDAWQIIKSDILKITARLKKEPLALDTIEVFMKQREQEKQFWQKFEETHFEL